MQRVANMHEQRIAMSDKCTCGQPQMVNHFVESYPLMKPADNCRLQLHSVDDDVVTCLIDAAIKALVN